MLAIWVYHLCGLLLLAAQAALCVATCQGLPGTWAGAGLALLAAWFLPEDPSTGLGLGWGEASILLALAALGEIGHALGTPKVAGGTAGDPITAAPSRVSRRTVWSASVGGLLGAVTGLTIGLPLPLIGPPIAGVAGGIAGAFAGGYVSERWLRTRAREEPVATSASITRRLIGRAARPTASAVMVLAFAVSYWLM